MSANPSAAGCLEGGAELTLPSVDDEQIRHREPLVAAAGQVAGDHLGDRGEVVLLSRPLDSEFSILGLLRPSRLEPDERAHGIAALIVGDVHAHEASGHGAEAEIAAERIHRVFGSLLGFERLDPETLEQVSRVLIGKLEPARRGSTLGNVPIRLRQELSQRIPLGWRKWQHQTPYSPLRRDVVSH